MRRNAGPPEPPQAWNGNGITFDLVWLGGNTRSPAASVGGHVVGDRAPTSTMPRTACSVWPVVRVTDLIVWPELRVAALPNMPPWRLTAETPGKPRSMQAWPDRLVKFS